MLSHMLETFINARLLICIPTFLFSYLKSKFLVIDEPTSSAVLRG